MNTLAGPYQIPYLRRRHFDIPHIQEMPDIPDFLLDGVVFRTSHNDKLAFIYQNVYILPGMKRRKDVGADDKEYPGFRIFLFKITHGIYGIGFALSLEFHIREREAGIVFDSQLHHRLPVPCFKHIAPNFVRRSAARDEVHFLKLKLVQYILGHNEVAYVHGIKSSAKQSYPSAQLAPYAQGIRLLLYLKQVPDTYIKYSLRVPVRPSAEIQPEHNRHAHERKDVDA